MGRAGVARQFSGWRGRATSSSCRCSPILLDTAPVGGRLLPKSKVFQRIRVQKGVVTFGASSVHNEL
jgi:hypothetical protein